MTRTRPSLLGSAMFLLLLVPALAHAATRKVPSQYATIQAGINAAASGDTVLIADGTYMGTGNRDLDFLGKSLTVQSEHGPARTIIDCQGKQAAPHIGFFIHDDEPVVVIDGFTVRNGYNSPTHGGGISVVSDRATVTNCIFQNNTAPQTGGGLYIRAMSDATVTNCTFSNNTATIGGGVSISGDNATLTNCTFSDNTAALLGGGARITSLNAYGSAVRLTNCTFSDNTATDGGGGASVVTEKISVTDCAFSDNIVRYGSGGGADLASAAVMTNCSFRGNRADEGGGVYCSTLDENTTLTNCTFGGNRASRGGGGAFIASSFGGGINPTATVTNCSFFGNTAGDSAKGGAAYVSTTEATVKNCIAWGDMAATEKEFSFSSVGPATLVSVTFSDIKGGYPGAGNRDIDPKFVNAAAGDLHLQPTSPCLSAGTHADAPTTDLEGNLRPSPPSIGAYDIAFALKFLSLNPSSVYGGETSTGTLTLTRPAPAGGATITLSSNTGYALVSFFPVTIAAGASSATFSVTSKPVTVTKAATLAAAYNGGQKSATLLIYAPVLKYLTLSPTTVKGGHQNSVATVTLTSPAPVGGTLVTLSSNTGYAIVPGSILVPAGGRVAAFTVVTKPVSAAKGATITATEGSVTKSVGLLLTP